MKIPKIKRTTYLICINICCFNLHIFFVVVVKNDNSFQLLLLFLVVYCVFVLKLNLTFKEFQFDSMNLSSALNYAYNESKKERKTVRETEA